MSERRNKIQARKLLVNAKQLMALARELEGSATTPAALDYNISAEPDDTLLAQLARQIYAARRQRTGFLDNPDFSVRRRGTSIWTFTWPRMRTGKSQSPAPASQRMFLPPLPCAGCG